MRWLVPATRRLIVLLLALAVSVLGMVVPRAPSAQAAAGDPVSYAYDDAGRLVGATDPVGDTAKYSYDPAGNLTSIARRPSSQVSILAFSPGQGPAGTAVTISGTGFSATVSSNVVKFNGTTATVTSATTTRLVATVPAAATTGLISVTAPGGSATSDDPFTVAASKAPTITGFSPTTGVAGTAVTITGTGFDPTRASNLVAFNRTRANVTAVSSTSLTVEVPAAAGSGRISVRTPEGTAQSSADFIIPPPPSTPAAVEVADRLAFDVAKTVSITTSGNIALLLFEGSADQRVSLTLSNSTIAGICGGSASLAILKPDGSTLASGDVCSGRAFLGPVSLPVDGTYTVLVDPISSNTGSASVQLYNVVDVTGSITVDGPSVPVSLTTPGQTARLGFAGTANQRVSLTLSNSTIAGICGGSASLAILKPDGSTLASGDVCSGRAFLGPVSLPVDGTYTVLVDPISSNTGSATVTLATAPSSGPTATSSTSSSTSLAGKTSQPSSPPDAPATGATDSSAEREEGRQPRQLNRSTAAQASAEETWFPDRLQLHGDPWLSRRPRTVWERLPALKAPAGTTAAAGQTLTLDGQPLAKVTLRLEDRTATTDATGRFVLTKVPAGRHVLVVDGRSASRPGRAFGVFEIGVDLTEGKTTALPATVWMPRLDTAHTERFASPTTGEVVVKTPRIPGLEVRVPAGSTIRDRDGKVVKELGITAIPIDRPPFPLPADVQVPIYFTVQPGGAYVFPEGARIIYPNYTHERPGTRVNFWSYDPKGKGWHIYGKGTVTADGKQVVPDPGVRVYAFTGAMINLPGLVAAAIGAIKDAFAAISGDPVDLGTGLFINAHTDLALSDTLPISITRTYRQSDSASRPFGIGTNFDYGMFLQSANQYTEADLVFPDSSKIHYVRTSPGTGWTDAVFEAQNTPTAFYKSKIVWNGNGWNLTLRDGTVYVFGENQPLQAIRDRYGNQITLTRTNGQAGNITQITSPNGKWIKLSYDSGNRITGAEDLTGRAVTYTYDTGGRLTQVNGPANKVTKYAYNASHQLTTITDARDIVYLTNEYDANGRIKKQTQADQTTYQFAYTVANGKVTETQVTDPRGNIRKVTFDAAGFVTSDTAAFGTPQAQTTTLERQPGSNFVTALTDQLSRRTAFGYDTNGNLTSLTRLAGTSGAQTITSVYDGPFSQVSEVTDPLNHKTSFDYDSRGNLTKVTDALNRTTTFGYNNAGQPTSAKNGLDHTTRFTYELGDLATVEDPLGRTSRQFVDPVGRVGSVTDPAGNQSRVRYDDLNQVSEVTDPLGHKTSFTYDANGNQLTVKDTRDKTTTYTYDQMDRVDTLTDPLGKIQRYTYDANGNLATLTSRRNKTTSYTYDPLDRLTQVKYGVAGTSAESTVGYSWDGGNRLTQINDSAAGTITYTPDTLDRITSEATPQGSIGYSYDAADRLTSMTVAGQPQVSYGYNNADQPTTITRGSQSVSVNYDSVGRPTTLNLPGGVSETYGLDAASQLTAITYKRGTTTLGDLRYGYDQAGRTATVGGSFARVAIPSPFSSASYNANNQLTSRAGATYSYDDDGNLTGDGTTTYSWNARGQLTGLSRTGLTASFAYDPTGRRSRKTIKNTATGYLHDGANPTQELSGTTPTANLLSGGVDQYFTRTDKDGQRTFLTDALGSTIALTDSSGTIKTSYTYEPFGKTTPSGTANSNPFQYTGREDDGTGLYYYRARYYHPGLQRFISEDPAGFAAGDTNLYAYVGNNPTNLTDPSGENPAGRIASACLSNAAISGGISYLQQRLSGRKVNWGWGGGVGGSALQGCLFGGASAGLASLLGKLKLGGTAGLPYSSAITGGPPAYDAQSSYSRLSTKISTRVLKRQPRCAYCGRNRSTAVDHIRSKKQDWEEGGWQDPKDVRSARVNDESNLTGACKSCNSSKGERSIGLRRDRGEWWPPDWDDWWPFGR